jgi:hypothetical protein
MKLTDAHTITAVVVSYTQGNGRKTLGQIAIEDLPPVLRDPIKEVNEFRLDEIVGGEEE